MSSRAPEPALATPCREPFFEDGWIYERRLGGERCLAVRTAGGLQLFARSRREITRRFPEVAAFLEAQRSVDFVLDGEVVTVDGSRTGSSLLRQRTGRHDVAPATRDAVLYYVFDVLRADGEDLTGRPLTERKRRLRSLVGFADPVRLMPHQVDADAAYLKEACARGWDGLIAKKDDAAYPSGRTTAWLTFRCAAGQELVVVGWTDPQATRVGIGALMLGYHAGDDLVYAGKVGTGFSHAELRDLHSRLVRREVPSTPCTAGNLPTVGVHWTRPELVAQIGFTEWTAAGQLRHPRYLGLRRDKRPDDVVRE